MKLWIEIILEWVSSTARNVEYNIISNVKTNHCCEHE